MITTAATATMVAKSRPTDDQAIIVLSTIGALSASRQCKSGRSSCCCCRQLKDSSQMNAGEPMTATSSSSFQPPFHSKHLTQIWPPQQ